MCRPLRFTLILVAALIAGASAYGQVRTWTSIDGKHTIEADFVEMRGVGNIAIKKVDGTVIEVPLTQLSSADQAFVKRLIAPAVSSDSSTANSVLGAVPPSDPGVPVSKMDETQRTRAVRGIEAEANRAKTAEEAVVLYSIFLSDLSIPYDIRKEASEKFPEWKEKSDKGLVKLGLKWVTVEEAKDARIKADYMVKQAIEFFKAGQEKLAFEKLQTASTTNPNDVTADFILGCAYAIAKHDFKNAEISFQKCLLREPENPAVLNNLALTLIRLNRADQATQYWRRAGAVCRDERIAQNMARLFELSSTKRMQKVLSEGVLRQMSEVYGELVVGREVKPVPSERGWQYLVLPQKVPLDETEVELPTDPTVDSAIMVCADAIVVAPEYVLTTRSSTRGRTGFLIADPGDTERKLEATIVASSKYEDLALLHCPKLSAPTLAFDIAPPRPNTHVTVAGYPLADTLATSLKTASGQARLSVNIGRIDVLAYDVLNAPSVAGGPVADEMGNVVAMHWKTPTLGSSQFSVGIPAARCLAFVERSIPGRVSAELGGADLSADQLKTKLGKSSVVVLAQAKAQDVGLTSQVGEDCFYDPSCCRCNGTLLMSCPNYKCVAGGIPYIYTFVSAVNPITKEPIYGSQTRYNPCPVCRATKSVPCGVCVGTGIDPTTAAGAAAASAGGRGPRGPMRRP
jgi:hypothetical protein